MILLKNLRILIGAIVVVIGLIVLFLLVSPFTPIKLGESNKTFGLIVSASILSIFLMAVKETKRFDTLLIESLEVLLLIIIATVAVFPLLSNPTSNLQYGAILVMAVTFGWYAFYFRRFNKVHKIEINNTEISGEMQKRQKLRFWYSTCFFAYVIALGIIMLVVFSP